MSKPEITKDGSHTLYSEAYKQTFHSRHGALTETRHVFLRASGVTDRLAQGLATTILEIGFGTGLNFLATMQEAQLANTPLHFVSLEQHLLSGDVLAQLNHGSVLQAPNLCETFLDWRGTLPDVPPPGTYRKDFSEHHSLNIIIGDATVVDIPTLGYDATYLDAFSPDANPELWTIAFFERLYTLLNEDGKLSTYSAKSLVRRNLQAAGFFVEKLPGPPGKREMLVATR